MKIEETYIEFELIFVLCMFNAITCDVLYTKCIKQLKMPPSPPGGWGWGAKNLVSIYNQIPGARAFGLPAGPENILAK